eukprot:SAG11_NODE_10221_length_846_cov_0.931727_1_plen_101_part_10
MLSNKCVVVCSLKHLKPWQLSDISEFDRAEIQRMVAAPKPPSTTRSSPDVVVAPPPAVASAAAASAAASGCPGAVSISTQAEGEHAAAIASLLYGRDGQGN